MTDTHDLSQDEMVEQYASVEVLTLSERRRALLQRYYRFDNSVHDLYDIIDDADTPEGLTHLETVMSRLEDALLEF